MSASSCQRRASTWVGAWRARLLSSAGGTCGWRWVVCAMWQHTTPPYINRIPYYSPICLQNYEPGPGSKPSQFCRGWRSLLKSRTAAYDGSLSHSWIAAALLAAACFTGLLRRVTPLSWALGSDQDADADIGCFVVEVRMRRAPHVIAYPAGSGKVPLPGIGCAASYGACRARASMTIASRRTLLRCALALPPPCATSPTYAPRPKMTKSSVGPLPACLSRSRT